MASVDSIPLSSSLQAAVAALKQTAQAEQQAALALTQQATQQLRQSTAALSVLSSHRGGAVNISV